MSPPRVLLLAIAALGLVPSHASAAAQAPHNDPLKGFVLPDPWQDRFWSAPGVMALLDFEPGALAALVPTQAGLRFTRCPSCGAGELDDTLQWSPEKPGVVTCRRCSVALPNDTYPAKITHTPGLPPGIPEEVIEVHPRVFQHYPYHLVEAEKQAYPDERLYLAAKHDYEARAFLAKAALYAAVRHRDLPPGQTDPRYARLAAILIVRFAQVYGDYALHDDQPNQPKILHTGDLRPPYRPGYRTSRWDWQACHEVPLPLLIAYVILRDDPALAEAGTALGEADPRRHIEESLIRPAAALLATQDADASELTLYAARGLLAAGTLLADAELVDAGLRRLEFVIVRGFRHDGVWQSPLQADQLRVAELMTDWIDPLLLAAAPIVAVRDAPRLADAHARLALARAAVSAASSAEPVVRAAFSGSPPIAATNTTARLLGATGLATLAVGPAQGLLQITLGPPDSTPDAPAIDLRVEVNDNRILGDPTAGRSGIANNVLFFAADDTLQVAALASADATVEGAIQESRQLVVAVNSRDTAYAVSVYEPGATPESGPAQSWTLAEGRIPVALNPRPTELNDQDHTFSFQGPAQFELIDGQGLGLRLHLLDPRPARLSTLANAQPTETSQRLTLTRLEAASDPATPPFVSLIEPVVPTLSGGVVRVGRLRTPPTIVGLAIETVQGREYILINRQPGTPAAVQLPDGRTVRTDGLAVLLRDDEIALVGGTVVQWGDRRVEHPAPRGTVRASRAMLLDGALGSFEVRGDVGPAEPLVGRTLIIQHADGVRRGWTIDRVDILGDKWARYWVREAPGFVLDASASIARYHTFPQADHSGPHAFRVCMLTRKSFPPDLTSIPPR